MDLGTYHVRVVFHDGDGFIDTWGTGRRYTNGCGDVSPLSATAILPTWESEDDLASTVEWAYGGGNMGCDCNKRLYLDRAHQRDEGEYHCGEELRIKSLTLIRPDGSERELEPRE